MLITICQRTFDTNDIKSLTIRDHKIFIETTEDYLNLPWRREEEIREAQDYLKFQELTRKELIEAVNLIMLTCDYFINEKDQCQPCPLRKREGCIFGRMPIDWRE